MLVAAAQVAGDPASYQAPLTLAQAAAAAATGQVSHGRHRVHIQCHSVLEGEEGDGFLNGQGLVRLISRLIQNSQIF